MPTPPAPAFRHYRPRRALWDNKAVRAGTVALLLALCGLLILALVREQTGTPGFLVGLGLAVLPVPLLIAAFRWMDRVEPKPWKNLIFAFAWGACAATLVALLANGYATKWLMNTIDIAHREEASSFGATFVAPVVEESAKAAAVLLLYLYRRRDFNGIVDGVVIAGITATGFAFTENILYLGNAYASDQSFGASGFTTTAGTFVVRVLMSPFAHPLFTSMTGLGFGIAATLPAHRRALRALVPFVGLLTAMVLHGVWNGSASLPGLGFLIVYALFMVPVFGTLTWLTIWSRQTELRTIRAHLPEYQAAGWLTPPEPLALSSMRARAIARDVAKRAGGPGAARTVAEYISFATSLAFLRQRAYAGRLEPDFAAREQELLHHLWQRKGVAQPALERASLSLVRPTMTAPSAPCGMPPAYGPAAAPGWQSSGPHGPGRYQ
ncbi:PrsW family intramembrane metalloprotease [Streptomyces sp. AV19]|uniref:PrsW family intramembrane metalloprotease n=1 Tax=Streptomyces sp. AV19 TaxID=2793068 RepID=UPI00241367A8|nr:PrsW family intramembrane metalloprotease [Streptomyces sp. AV19]MDG4530915.1 PrsW family intramembrane metalloprotease [Streptomyces sp. AV19]